MIQATGDLNMMSTMQGNFTCYYIVLHIFIPFSGATSQHHDDASMRVHNVEGSEYNGECLHICRLSQLLNHIVQDLLSFDDDTADTRVLGFKLDDIKVEHHPHSGIPTKVHAFGDFKRRPVSSVPAPEPDELPWRPFKSRLEFDVAEIALQVALNNELTDRLIQICRRCALGTERFTFENHKDVRNKWDAASQSVTGVGSFLYT